MEGRVCIADHNETQLEAMALSDPVNCVVRDGTCMTHDAFSMLQFYLVELAEIHVDGGLLQLYGYLAVRDDIDPFCLIMSSILAGSSSLWSRVLLST